ncbi:class I SAM-dependent DNA methyltransferase [Thetidibacter halocola]|uniref:Class I SAM-dependent methyltransferase n=1 Tax=Thetidibacter halocola TaxID=2827239 RepID=A0A8J7WED0_9RHOB|nr:class I SAM-dependent methyltransferase [Thetidibacter halocola]MBS0126067.1 class I SAM-dependent methyltransferase [Thetidibacter halocola]
MTGKKPGLDAAYGLEGADANRRLYADWAETYDRSFAQDMAYCLPQAVAQTFHAEGGVGPVLDLGAGTGLCGQALAALGVGPVDGTDLSAEMLAVARDKGVYCALFEGDLLARLPVADGAYTGAVSSGTFTHGHVGPEALDEVLRILAPGGLAVLSVNAEHWEARGFARRFDALSERIEGLKMAEMPIYGEGATGPHAQDRALIVVFRRH